MKRVIFSVVLLTLLVAISFGSFAATSKNDSKSDSNAHGHKAKNSMHSHHVIHPVDHFTI